MNRELGSWFGQQIRGYRLDRGEGRLELVSDRVQKSRFELLAAPGNFRSIDRFFRERALQPYRH